MEGGVEGDRKVSCSGCDRLEDSLDRLEKGLQWRDGGGGGGDGDEPGIRPLSTFMAVLQLTDARCFFYT